MLKASEYRKHAEECRKLAAGMDASQLALVQEMVRTWEQLAAERMRLISRHPELALNGEYDGDDQTMPRRRSTAEGAAMNAPGDDDFADDEATT